VKVGIVRFPGSCDELDALGAASLVGEAVVLWHAEPDLRGVDVVVIPGGFSYGDYLRAGAIARFAPVMGPVARFARDGGPVLGICNGFQVLCEASLLPGALLANRHLRFRCRQVACLVDNPNGSVRDIAGVCNADRNVFGLMPHPEHAVDALTGSSDGLCIFESLRQHVDGALAVA
jgi:phosphoribosylformylglycinamidine (FGAM) synthase-like amidotransferase family enzyme